MSEKQKLRSTICLLVWFFLTVVLFVLLFNCTSKREVKGELKDKMVEASELAQRAFDTIKQEKIDRGIGISEEDILNTGLIGSGKKTTITSTEGVLEAKRTTCNPEWAAMIVKCFEKAGIQEGDDIGMIFSGSFPALNICVMAACETYHLNSCMMASIGASYYGANQVDFTFLDMSVTLYEKGIFSKKIDYISMGGADDIGYNFRNEDDVNSIKQRITDSGVTFLYEEDYKTNINNRLEILKEEVPNQKLFINCGGTIVAYGEGASAFTESGYFTGNQRASTWKEVLNRKNEKTGLIECVKMLGVDILSLKNIKDLAIEYGLPYDPLEMPEIGTSDLFFTKKYNAIFLVLEIIVSLLFSFYFCLERLNKVDFVKDKLLEKMKKQK